MDLSIFNGLERPLSLDTKMMNSYIYHTYITFFLLTSIYCFHVCPKAMDCGSLTAPTNGRVTVNNTSYRGTATFSCNIGYSLIGDDFTTCTANGTWNGTDPTCEGV